jgi:DNA-binding transcriptional ArsR family regulator
MSLPELYSALADPTRLKVLEMLHAKARPVHELAAAFDISRPAISRHLRVLKEAGLVKEVKQGRENVYSFQRAPLKTGLGWLEKHQAAKAARGRKPRGAAPAAPTDTQIVVAETRLAGRGAEARPGAGLKPRAPKPAPAPASPLPSAPQLSFFDL